MTNPEPHTFGLNEPEWVEDVISVNADRVIVPMERAGGGGWFYCLGCGEAIGRESFDPPHTVLDCLRAIRRWVTELQEPVEVYE